MPLRIPFLSKQDDDPYWDRFVNRAPDDANNQAIEFLRRVPEGSVYAVQTDPHTPEIMAGHIKELARFFGADLVGVVRRSGDAEWPFAIVHAYKAPYDPRTAKGPGGQAAAMHGAFTTFNLGSSIREFGFRAHKVGRDDAERLAVLAGLGTVSSDGRVVAPELGPVYVADVIYTDLPLAADAEERA